MLFKLCSKLRLLCSLHAHRDPFKKERSRMADTERTKLEEMLICPVCRDIFKDPRQLPCGHSMCMGCVEKIRDHSTSMPFRCPDCREYFGQIIMIQKNYALSNITEDFRVNRSRRVFISTFFTCNLFYRAT